MYSKSMLDKVTAEGSVVGYALEILFPSGAGRSHTGVGQLLIDGEIYYGVGQLGKVGMIESLGDENPVRLNVELSGLPGEYLSHALAAEAIGSDCKLWLVAFDQDGQLLQYEPAAIGFVSDYGVIAGDENRISITISDEFEKYEMPLYEFWTDENHRSSHDDDRLCRYGSQMSNRELQWGSSGDAPPFNYVS